MFGIEKVEISKDAWHFKWLRFLHFVGVHQMTDWNNLNQSTGRYGVREVIFGPKSVCPYFWLLMGSFLIVMGASAILVGLLGLAVMGVLQLLVWIKYHPSDALEVLFVVLLFAVAVVAIWFLISFIHWVIRQLSRRPDRVYADERTRRPSIVMAYIRTKKNKVCPMVEYT